MTEKEVKEYLDRALKRGEIRRSGLVLDALGPTCQEMGLVKRVELKEDGGYRLVPLQEVRDTIAGYPVDLIITLFKEKFREEHPDVKHPRGNYQGKELIGMLRHARRNLEILFYSLTGEWME